MKEGEQWNMRSGILFFILFAAPSAVFTNDAVQHKNTTLNEDCQRPSIPANGNYQIITKTPPSPDQKPYDIITVTCNPGYTLIGEKNITCLQGSWSDQMPECLPSCVIDEETSVVTLEVNARRCVLDPLVRESIIELLEDAFISGCGIAVSNIAYFMISGEEAEEGQLPWQVGIYRKTITPYEQICGGSIVSKNVVISAAHCFWDDVIKQLPAEKFAVEAGKLYRPYNNDHDMHAQRSDVKEINIPPRFQGAVTRFQEDIALVIVVSDFTFNDHVLPVHLDFNYELDCKQLQPGSLGAIGGWGLTAEYGDSSPVLKVVEMPYINIKECIAECPFGFQTYITSDKFCAGYRNGTALCKGDSGGGLVFPTSNNGSTKYYLRGIASTTPNNGDADCQAWTWATYTHIIRHEHFIRSVLEGSSCNNY